VPAEADCSDRGAWQTADAVTFLRSVQQDRLNAAWLLSMLGLRRGEVLGLRWQDVGLDTLTVRESRISVAGQIHVGTPKAKASRRVLPLPPVVVDALRELRRIQTAERLAAGADTGTRTIVSSSTRSAARTDQSGTPTRSLDWCAAPAFRRSRCMAPGIARLRCWPISDTRS